MLISELSTGDISAAVGLANAVGWDDTPADWAALFSCGKVFGHRDLDGSLVGAGALCDFGPIITLAKMIVREDVRGRGVGRAVLERCLAARPSEATTTLLVATPLGRLLYDRAGFVPVETVHVLMGTRSHSNSPASSRVEPFDRDDREGLLALDRTASGGDRERMLDARLRTSKSAVVVRKGGVICGFGLATVQRDHVVVGPVIANDVRDAHDIIDALIDEGAKVRIDVPGVQSATFRHLEAAGLEVVGSRVEMALGGRVPACQRERRFALASLAYG